MNSELLVTLNQYIRCGNVPEFIVECENYQNNCINIEYQNYTYAFMRLYNNAVLYKQIHIVKYLLGKYRQMGDVDKIALKPTFKYCKYIAGNKGFHEYFEITDLP